MNAVVTTMLAQLREQPERGSVVADELLSGTIVTVNEPRGDWALVTAAHRYTGWLLVEELDCCVGWVQRWQSQRKLIVTAATVDLMTEPRYRSVVVGTLLRGSRLEPQGEVQDGWQPVMTAQGLCGMVRSSAVAGYPLGAGQDEAALRASLVATARGYLGCSYRWGGKTPLGIDCSGLTSQCYLAHGIVIWRDAQLVEGYAAHTITREQLAPADLIYWRGHTAMYLGDSYYLHANATDGFATIASLDPAAPSYRPDLGDSVVAYGSVF